MRVLIFCTTFVWNISHAKKNSALHYQTVQYIGLHVKLTAFLSYFNEPWTSSTDFWKKYLEQNFTKIRPVGFELFHAEAETDRLDVVSSRFSQFCGRVQKFSFYWTENTVPHHYKHQAINADQRQQRLLIERITQRRA